ncbi:unnamed protein product [Nippostrongylus brasiliensis]|uniref:Enkurin domain-containing protein n=1 Tax=Nippostrongylus brasiliensis TaxID=27835 RepID=A0A0N4Y038_NIPBR|nr:unnamed protein product [Nippostrongylus brasiliensis]
MRTESLRSEPRTTTTTCKHHRLRTEDRWYSPSASLITPVHPYEKRPLKSSVKRRHCSDSTSLTLTTPRNQRTYSKQVLKTVEVSKAQELEDELPPDWIRERLAESRKVAEDFDLPIIPAIFNRKPAMVYIGIDEFEGRVRKIRDWFERKTRHEHVQMQMDDDKEAIN